MAKRLHLDDLAVDSFEPIGGERGAPQQPGQPGGADLFYIAPGETNESCTLFCTLYELPCC